MYAKVEKPKRNKSRTVINSHTQKKSNVKQGFGFMYNRQSMDSEMILGLSEKDNKRTSHTPILQMYKELKGIDGKMYRQTNDELLVVSQEDGRNCFFASDGVEFASALLPYLKYFGTGMILGKYYNAYIMETQAIQDCGVHALSLMKIMHGYNSKNKSYQLEIINTKSSGVRVTDLVNLHVQELTQAEAKVGQAFYTVNNPNYKELDETQYNFHWGAIIGKSGTDVLTSEIAPHKNMWFQIYNEKPESFGEHYIAKGKLQADAKTFLVQFRITEKGDSTEVIDLDDD